MRTKKTPMQKRAEISHTSRKSSLARSSEAYGDKIPICANLGCALRKKAKCFGFEGCPGFQSR